MSLNISRPSCRSYLTATPLDLHGAALFLSPSLRFGCSSSDTEATGRLYSRAAHHIYNVKSGVWERLLEKVQGLKFSVCMMSELDVQTCTSNQRIVAKFLIIISESANISNYK